jgi:hypothetical protein
MENKLKVRIKKIPELYKKYFFNPINVIEEILNDYKKSNPINEDKCEVIFDVSEKNNDKIYELIRYYPNKLKEYKYITDNVINDMYMVYGETIEIMKENKTTNNVRGRLCSGAKERVRTSKKTIPCDIISEDIILVRKCPYLDIELEYGNIIPSDFSPSLDKIIPSLGYVKGNIQVISMLSNNMKSSSTIEQLITFSNNVLKLHKK